jgi:hypothetical protein
MNNTESISALAGAYLSIKKNIEADRHRLYDIEVQIREMMDDMGATEISLDNFKVKLESKTEYLKERLTPLLEYEEIPPRELENARTPEKIIPASWNMIKVKPLAKYSARVKDLIESCTVQGEPVLKIVS